MKRNAFISMVALWGISLIPAKIYGQANLPIKIRALSNGVSEVSWPVRSLVPVPGAQIFPAFRLTVSSNLVDWHSQGDAIVADNLANQTAKVPITNDSPRMFVKVESILDFTGAELILVPLGRANFERATFFGADLFAATLDDANLRGADLRATDLRTASLERADLRGADLFGSTLAGSTLTDADLQGADLSFSDLTDAKIDGANLTGCDLSFTSLLGTTSDFTSFHNTRTDENTRMDEKTRAVWRIVNSEASGGIFTNLIMRFSNLTNGDLSLADFSNTDLRGSDVQEANLIGTKLLKAQVDFVDFRGAIMDQTTQVTPKVRLVWEVTNQDSAGRDLQGADLSNSFFVRARLAGANLQGANLTFSVFPEADLSGANLRLARMTDVNAIGVNFQNADLTGANLSRADLTDANLKGATVTSTIFTGATFSNTTMPDGTIR